MVKEVVVNHIIKNQELEDIIGKREGYHGYRSSELASCFFQWSLLKDWMEPIFNIQLLYNPVDTAWRNRDESKEKERNQPPKLFQLNIGHNRIIRWR